MSQDKPTETKPVVETREEPAQEAAAETAALSAQALMENGTRSLAHKKYAEACDELARAVEQLVNEHGELSLETADAYLLYGQALLKMAISQSGVLGSAPEKEQVEQSIQAAAEPSTSASGSSSLDPKQMNFHFGGDAEDDDDGDDQEEGDDGEEGGQEGEDEEGAGYDREDDLEQAFMMLDSARTIWNKQEGEQYRLKEAEAHRLLGEVSSESEQFESAVNEYSSALSILSRILPEHDRQLSELHMLIALTLEFVPDKLEQAVSHAEKARHVLELKKHHLERNDSPSDSDKKEIEDLESLIQDVDAKIEDLKLVPTEPAPTESDVTLAKMIEGASARAAAGGGPVVVNDLSLLVKKKKKPAAPASTEEAPESASNGKRKATDEETPATVEKKLRFADQE